MTEQADPPLVRGLIDPEEIEDDGSDVEDATEMLLRLRSGGERPESVAARADSEANRPSGDGVQTGRGVRDDRDAADPA